MTTIGAADGGLLGTLCSYRKGYLRGPLRKIGGAPLGAPRPLVVPPPPTIRDRNYAVPRPLCPATHPARVPRCTEAHWEAGAGDGALGESVDCACSAFRTRGAEESRALRMGVIERNGR